MRYYEGRRAHVIIIMSAEEQRRGCVFAFILVTRTHRVLDAGPSNRRRQPGVDVYFISTDCLGRAPVWVGPCAKCFSMCYLI